MYHWYFIILFIFFVLGIAEQIFNEQKINWICYFLSCTTLVLFTGLKYSGGTDLENIKIEYDIFSSGNVAQGRLEVFYVVWMSLFCNILAVPFQYFYFTSGLFNIGTKITLFKKYTPFLMPAVLIYFIGMYMERDNDGIRQGMSCSIAYIGMFCLLKKKTIKYMLLTTAACFIHSTSIIFYCLYPLQLIKCKDRYIAFTVSSCMLFPLLKISFFNFFCNNIPIPFIRDKIMHYVTLGDESFTGEAGIGVGLIFRIIILLLFLHYHNKMQIKERMYLLLRNGFAGAIIVSLIFHDIAILSHRLPYGLRELQAFIVPFFMTCTHSKFKRCVILFIIFAYTLALLIRLITKDEAGHYLYQSILFN